MALKQHVSAVNYPPFDETRLFRNHMRTRWSRVLNVQNFGPMQRKIIGDQHTVAVKKHLFRAHDGGGSALSKLRDALRSFVKLRREHVIGVVAERFVTQ